MCGRAATAPVLSWNEYYQVMGFDLWLNFKPSYNVTPTQPLPCIRVEDGQRSAFVAKWGLIPSWAKDPKIGAQCSNARSDTVAEKPAFRAAFKKRRCLVAVTGFYEWDQHHIVKGKPKQPYYFTLQDGRPMTFAGLWESWISPEQQTIETCTIITCGPNEIMEPLHDRLPVILPSNLWDVWLDPEMDPVGLKDLLVPFDAHEMQLWPVSSKMNSTRGSDYHFGLECIEPQIQQSLF
jgi:putative SOS response-associated peptidase YedK